jgi:class 3 adenylate cyclase
LPTGTVTFMRSDVEGSMSLVRALGSAWDDLNASHLGIIRDAVEEHGGVTVRTEGDALFAVFPEAGAAIRAVIAAQRALHEHPWPREGGPRVRMGLHSGEAHLSGDDYGGFEVNRAARIAGVGNGGQIVVSAPTQALVADALPAGVLLRDLGEHALRDLARPERLYQLDVPGLPRSFPPLRTRQPTAGNLPARLTTFLGRDAELVELGARTHQRRSGWLPSPPVAISRTGRRIRPKLDAGTWRNSDSPDDSRIQSPKRTPSSTSCTSSSSILVTPSSSPDSLTRPGRGSHRSAMPAVWRAATAHSA